MSLPLDPDSGRLRSLDAYRGFVMLAMASGGIETLGRLGHSGDSAWSFLLQGFSEQFDHVQWRGCTFWDLIQPSFMFLVGAAMPFSYVKRRAAGDTPLLMFGHAVYRSLVLIVLAIFLSSTAGPKTNFIFTNVLAQIGLGYTFVYMLLAVPPALQLGAAILILAGYWLFFAGHHLPAGGFPYGDYGADEPLLMMKDFFAHWNKNTNAAADFDRWFLNLFPGRDARPFLRNQGGYATLNFIPSIATMLFGVLAGELLGSSQTRGRKLRILFLAGLAGIALGLVLNVTLCPIVKRIWTPSWVVFSTGWTCWMLAAFFGLIDVAGYRRWAFPLVVVGMNSIAIYVMAQIMKPFVVSSLRIHLPLVGMVLRYLKNLPLNASWLPTELPDVTFDGPNASLLQGLLTLLVLWLICFWMYRHRIFIKI
jgi:heparan-alpha-glucosaminide N-acetyltransferase